MPDPLVSARHLTKRFGDFTAVDDIDFQVHPGEAFGFLGPNGAGKSSPMKMIAAVSPVTEGELTVLGMDPAADGPKIRARLGVVPQEDNLDPDFSVEENLRIYASFFRLPAAHVEQRIPELLAFAALTDRRTARPDQLSGGMKRRLTIARALVNDPELVVLDEPTTGLDPQARHLIWGRLDALRRRGVTLLLTTHYMEEAERLCDELLIMDHGRILDQGSPRALIGRHVEPEVIEVRSNGGLTELTASIESLPGCRSERHGTSHYCYAQDAKPLLDQLRKLPDLTFLHRPANLEDVFLKLTGRELRD